MRISSAQLCIVIGFFAGAVATAQTNLSPATLPQGGVVTHGQANIQTAGTSTRPVLNVDQTSARAVIDWNTFNVGSAATVNFNQPNTQSATLNRVSDLNPSQIFGRINAPGQVTLINPAGIYFSPSAVLDVGALTATSMQQSDADFMAGVADFNRNGAQGAVINDGTLTARLGGYIALLAPEVRNQGVIVAQEGAVVLGAADAIRLVFDPASRLTNLTVTPSQIAALVENKTVVRAPDGMIILSATAVDRLMGSVVNHGQLEASSLTAKGGRILLEADTIALAPNSRIEAKGATGGGEILIGGDWQGAGPLRQAKTLTMADTAVVDASATEDGRGGKIVLWTDVSAAGGETAVAGQINARGAGANASGGDVETSGHQLSLADSANVNLGTGGRWLLDPANVVISGSSDSNHTGFVPDSGVSSAVVNLTTLLTALNAGTDVTVTTTNSGTAGSASGDLTVSSAITTTGTGAGGLILNAARNVLVNANITLTGTGKPLTFIAGKNVDQAASVTVTTAGGTVTYNSDRDGSLDGAVGLRNNARVITNGGDIIMGGGTNPLTTPAYGESVFTSGVSIDNTNVVLNAGGGNINLRGYTIWGNGGVAANWQAQILTTGSGNITIIGNGASTGYGVGLDRTTISAQNGAITILGITGPSGREAVVSRVGNKIESTGSGTISISGTGGTGVYFGGWGQNFFIGGNSATGNITIAADLLTFSDAQATVKTTGTFTLKPYTAGATIGVGGGAGALQILSSYFTSNFVTGFSGITIGDATSGNVTVGGTNTTADSLTIVTGGNITLDASSSIATSKAGGTLALAAAGNFINNSGASALSTTDAGTTDRWIVYSATPANNTFGSLVSGNSAVWGETFSSQPPASVASGNRYVFATPASVTITTTSSTKTYGTTADISANVSYTGLPMSGATFGNAYTSVSLGTMLSTLPTISSAGAAATAGVIGSPYAITASGAVANSGYSISYANTGTLTVDKAHLTVTADNQSRTYGAANPTLTATISGFVNGETLGTSGVTGSASATTSATTSTAAGTAVITSGAGSLSAANYDFTTFNPGTLTIDKAHLTVTADNQNRTYGSANPTLTTTLSGFVNGETLGTSGVTGSGAASTTATTGTNAGTAVITAGVGTLAAGNYDFTTLNNGTLTIGKAPLTVTADNQNRTYGAANPTLTTTISGFVNGETLGTSGVTGSGAAGTTATSTTSAGTAVITAGVGTLAAGNYNFTTLNNGTLTIGKASLTVTANNDGKIYNGVAYTGGNGVAYSGFVNGETSGVLGGALNYSGSSQGAVNAGSYVITPTGLTSGNYNLSFAPGTLTITPVALSAIIGQLSGSTSKVYDGTTTATLASNNFTFTGFAAGEGVTVTKTTGAFDTANAGTGKVVTAALSSGDYVANGTTLLSNYTLPTSVSGAIGTITPKAVVFAAPTMTKVYDGNATGTVASSLLTQLSGQLGVSGDSVTAISLNYDNKNVGAGKTLNLSSAVISDGNQGNNYAITYASNSTGTITRLNSVTWIGGATGDWFQSANWSGGAVPDLANVANVILPAGVNATFGSTPAGVVQVDSIGSAGNLVLTGGRLEVGTGGLNLTRLRQSGGTLLNQGGTRLELFEQTGGSFATTGDFNATAGFQQSGAGALTVGGTTTLTGGTGDLVLGNTTSNGVFTANTTGGAITQSAGTALTLQAASSFNARRQSVPAAITLDQSGNRFIGPVSVNGSDITVTSSQALTMGTVFASGRLTLRSEGALNLGRSTVGGDLVATSGNAALTQSGPLSVGGRTTLRTGTGAVALRDSGNFFGSVIDADAVGATILDPSVDVLARRYARLQADPAIVETPASYRIPFKVEDIELALADRTARFANLLGDEALLFGTR